MKYKSTILLIIFLSLIYTFCTKPPLVQAIQSGRLTEQPIDLVIVIDNSGSMDADRRSLRFVAAKMMIDLLSERDRVGLVLFSSSAQLLTSELVPLNTLDNREYLKSQLGETPSGGTNYERALNSAYELLANDSGNQRAVIFLTDGEPEPFSDNQLSPLTTFRQENIPVFLIMLEYQDTPRNILEKVDLAFASTGPAPRYIDSHAEIARAFAAVLTELHPSNYLDVIQGIPDTNNLLRFEAQVSVDQRVSKVDFVFVSLQDSDNFDVSIINHPSGSAGQEFSGTGYSILSFNNTGSQPIDGKWVFNVNGNHPDSVEVFALIRSDIQLELVYPSGSMSMRNMATTQILPIGITVQGAAVESTQVEANVRNGTSCEIIDRIPGQTFPLNNVGLSSNNTVYWTKIAGMSNQNLIVNIEFKQLDLPLRLSRCFTVRSMPMSSQSFQIIQPTDTDTLQQSGIPLRVNLPTELNWRRVEAFIASPTGKILNSSLAAEEQGMYAGVATGIDTSGTYQIRFIATGLDSEGNAFTFFEETAYEVTGSLSPLQSIIDLGSQTHLDEILEGQIRLEAGLLRRDADVNFELVSVNRMSDASPIDSSQARVDLCPSPTFEGNQVVCDVEVYLGDVLYPGDYEAKIAIVAPGQRLVADSVLVRFRRPESGIELNEQVVNMGNLDGTNRILSYPLTFTPVLWRGDPQLEEPIVLELRDLGQQESVSTDNIEFEVRKTSLTENLAYELILRADEDLLAGRYEARISFRSSAQHLNISPSELVVRFDKDVSVIDLGFEDQVAVFSENVWGIPFFPNILPFLFNRTVYLHSPVTTNYTTVPPDIPAPSVIQIRQGNAVADVDTVEFMWRNDGQIENTNQYDFALKLKVLRALPSGEWDVRVLMNPPMESNNIIMLPQEQVFRIRVLGWKDFIWRRLFPFAIATFMLLAFLGNKKSSQTKVLIIKGKRLEWKGEQAMQLSRDQSGLFILIPNKPDSKIVFRSLSRDLIEIDFKNGKKPIQLKRGQTKGSVSFLP